jgi:hypothetical protein
MEVLAVSSEWRADGSGHDDYGELRVEPTLK